MPLFARMSGLQKGWSADAVLEAIGPTNVPRDIYYREPLLFKDQKIVDRYVDDIAFTCGVVRKDLNVVSSQCFMFVCYPGHSVTSITPTFPAQPAVDC